MHFHRNAVMLICSDMEQSKAFYTRHLGLEINADIGWFVGLQKIDRPREEFEMSLCETGHSSLPQAINRPTDGLVLAFEVDDVDKTFAAFQDAGVEILAELVNEPWGQRHFFAAAPDGVALDIFQNCPPDPEWMKAHGFA